MGVFDTRIEHAQTRLPECLLALGCQSHISVGPAAALEVQAEVVADGNGRVVRDGIGGRAVMGHEGAHGVYEGADRLLSARQTDVLGTFEQPGLQVVDGEPLSSEGGDDQGRDAGDVWTSHGRAGVGDVAAVRVRTDDAAARSAQVHPFSVVGETRPVAGHGDGADGETGLVVGRGTVRDVVVAGREHDQAALHRAVRQLVAVIVASRVLDEIVDGARD